MSFPHYKNKTIPLPVFNTAQLISVYVYISFF